MSVVVDIAEAVKDSLNAATLSQAFTAERAYAPVHKVEELDTLTVSVVPAGLSLQALSRKPHHLHDYVIDIAIQRHLAQGEVSVGQINAQCDPLMTLAEEVADLFRGKELLDVNAWCVGVANKPIFDPVHLLQQRVFTSVVTLTYRMGR